MKQTRCIQISAHYPSNVSKNIRITHINYYRTSIINQNCLCIFLFLDFLFALFSWLIWLLDPKSESELHPIPSAFTVLMLQRGCLTCLNIPCCLQHSLKQQGHLIFIADPVVRGQWSGQVQDNVSKFNTNTDVTTCAERKFQQKAQNQLDLSLLLTNYCCSFNNNNTRQDDKLYLIPSLIYIFGTMDAYINLSCSGQHEHKR